MAANATRPSLLTPVQLLEYDASQINATPNGEYINLKGLPNLFLKGIIKFPKCEEGRLRFALAIPAEDAEDISTFIQTVLAPKVCASTPTTRGRRSVPTQDLVFTALPDTVDGDRCLVNLSCNRVTKMYRIISDTEAEPTDDLDFGADAEIRCWIGVGKSSKHPDKLYVNLQPSQIVFKPSADKRGAENSAEVPSFGGKVLTFRTKP